MNILYLISGTSGSGKTELMRNVMNNEIVSFTTREKRTGEIDMVDYHFISKKEFQQLYENDELIEHTEYSGHFYGVERGELEKKLKISSAFLICDVNGMKQMKSYYPNSVSIFIYAEKDEIENRMKKRGDSEENIQKRLHTYEKESENAYLYDEVVVNRDGDFEETVLKIQDIVMEAYFE